MHVVTPLAVALLLPQGIQAPVLEFPEAGLDDPAAYEGYATRFFRDARGNAFQIYLDAGSGRVVHVWADAANASAAFTVRDTAGGPALVSWDGVGAVADERGGQRVMRHRLASELAAVDVGWFVLGTMRQERDFQYWEWHRRPFGEGRFALAELVELVATLERLPPEERARHLALLDAADLEVLRARLWPSVTLSTGDSAWTLTVEHTSLDGRNRMTLELSAPSAAVEARLHGDAVRLVARSGGGIRFDVTATTDAAALTPLGGGRIFNPAFAAFADRQRRLADSLRHARPAADQARDPRLTGVRRLEREILGLELLSYEEKLMAALPNYATYFGRDMMMTALMLEPVASVDLQERVIASVLRKLSPAGEVSHEEALGGQAIRENAAEYAARVRAWEAARGSDTAAARLAEARALLANLQAVRENYRMIDDDFQLPVLVARYLARPDVPADRKRRFFAGSDAGGATRRDGVLRNLALVAELARPYAERPAADRLVGFLHRDDDGWLPGSWRDSRAGYGNGRFAMDVNVVWVPQALAAARTILRSLEGLGLGPADAVAPLLEPERLDAAIATWAGARRHFEVRLAPARIRALVDAALADLPAGARVYWRRRLEETGAADRPLAFLAVALDGAGLPIPVANTDPATDLFLTDHTDAVLRGMEEPRAVVEMLDVFARPYPVGLFVEGLGPLVANDAYADSTVRRRFREDAYHSPRVVWGREVNLLFIGLARQIGAAYDQSGRPRDGSADTRAYVDALRRTLAAGRDAVEASGLRHNELWSYRIEGDTLRPVRYGTSSDIQLWNVTDLAVRFLLDRLP